MESGSEALHCPTSTRARAATVHRRLCAGGHVCMYGEKGGECKGEGEGKEEEEGKGKREGEGE